MSNGFGQRLESVRRRVADACARTGRDPDSVSILPVAKRFGPEAVSAAAESGIGVIGENRVQEARAKIPKCPGHLEWHMVGHLQRNKVKEAVRLFRMIHSVDSLLLLETINSASEEIAGEMPVCMEINVSGESSKFGFAPEEAPAILEKCGALLNVNVIGLMTMPPFTADPEGARPFFRRLRQLRDDLRERSGFPLNELSMGMSHDFEVAVEEGATWIRLGTVLFGARPDE